MPSPTVQDRHARPLRSLRVSVTDRCNLRCGYCMPEEEYVWLPRSRVLRYGQIGVVVAAAARLGVSKVRLTGGEPLMRRDLWRLVERLAGLEAIDDVALTTNALLLEAQARELHDAGLSRLTVSVDTLRPDRYRELTGRDGLTDALRGIDAARAAGFAPPKLNAVVMRGVNDDELLALLEFARAGEHELRFIEYMDVGGATRWSMDAVVPGGEILARIEAAHGPAQRVPRDDTSAPADRYGLPDGTVFGLITSTTQPFCGACDRARLTADGHLYTCLYARDGLDLGTPVREGADEVRLAELLAARWSARDDRGAEARLATEDRTRLVAPDELKGDPRLEMHTRGG